MVIVNSIIKKIRSFLKQFFNFYRDIFICYACLTNISYKKIIILSNKRLKLNLFDYKRIAKPLKKYITNEIWYYNEVYGFSHILKKYAGYKEEYKLKFIATHAVKYKNITGPGFSWEFEQNSPLIFTNSEFAKELIERFVNNTVKVISGSLQILYTDMHYNYEQFKKEKTRLGKNLLVFPAHSGSTTNSFYDVPNLINEIKRIRSVHNFDSVTICLFHRDIARGLDKQFFNNNFNITCAGHISDCNFFSRLRTIIELSDVTMANFDSSAMWYSLSLGKPFYLWNDCSLGYKNLVRINDPDYDEGWYKRHGENKEIIEIRQAFGEYMESITDAQRILIDKYCDMKNIKTPQEIKNIFNESEQMYKSGNYKKYEKKIVTNNDI